MKSVIAGTSINVLDNSNRAIYDYHFLISLLEVSVSRPNFLLEFSVGPIPQ